MRIALKAISLICGIAWCCGAFWFLALNYVAFWYFICGSLIGLIPFMLVIGSELSPHSPDCPERVAEGSERP